MPAILAIDTTTDACSVALVVPSGNVRESVSLAAREHTQHILPMIDTLLSDSGVALCELDAIAYGCGPGSFTGLRICLSVAQGLAYGADLPLIAISSLETMAMGAVRFKQLTNGLIVPAIDARMDEVYWSAYHVSALGKIEMLLPEQVTDPKKCRQQLLNLPYNTILGVGSGWHDAVLQQFFNSTFCSGELYDSELETNFFPRAYDVAEIAVARYTQGEYKPAITAQPTYLRNEIHWKKRERIRQV